MLYVKETPEFAAEAVSRWWAEYGKKRYPEAKEVLIMADAGGSNGYRCRMWKFTIHEILSKKYNIKVTGQCQVLSGVTGAHGRFLGKV